MYPIPVETNLNLQYTSADEGNLKLSFLYSSLESWVYLIMDFN